MRIESRSRAFSGRVRGYMKCTLLQQLDMLVLQHIAQKNEKRTQMATAVALTLGTCQVSIKPEFTTDHRGWNHGGARLGQGRRQAHSC